MQTTDTRTARNTELVLEFLKLIDRQQFDEAEPFLSPDFHLCFSGQHTDKEQTMALIRAVYQSFADRSIPTNSAWRRDGGDSRPGVDLLPNHVVP